MLTYFLAVNYCFQSRLNLLTKQESKLSSNLTLLEMNIKTPLHFVAIKFFQHIKNYDMYFQLYFSLVYLVALNQRKFNFNFKKYAA